MDTLTECGEETGEYLDGFYGWLVTIRLADVMYENIVDELTETCDG